MTESISKKIINNGLANLLQKLVRILDQLLLIPFFLTTWGASYYGEWLTLSIIPSILAFADLGIGSAVSNSFVLAYVAGEKQKAANIRKAGHLTIFLSIIFGIILTILILIIGNSLDLFNKSYIPQKDAMVAIVLITSARLLSFYNQLVEGYFRSVRKAALGSFISSGLHMLNIFSGLAVLLAGYKVIGYTLSQFLISILFTLSYIYIGRKQINLTGYSGKILKKDIKNIITKGGGYLMTPIWQSIYFQGGTLVVRIVLGAESVAIFNTVRTVCRSVNQAYSIINGSIYPELQYEYAKGNMHIVHKIFRISILISIFISFIGTLFLMIFGLKIYEWWTQNTLSVTYEIWWIFMIGILFNAIWWTSVVTYRVINQPYHFAIMSTIVACISVACSYFLSLKWGMLGAVIGTVIYDIIMTFYTLPDSCHLLGMQVKDLLYNFKTDKKDIIKYLTRKK